MHTVIPFRDTRSVDKPDVDRGVARVAASQHGLVSRAQALAAGASVDMIRGRVEAGRWVAVASGVYRVAGTPATWRQQALAAVLVSGRGAVVSHGSAAVLHGIDGFRPGPVHVTVGGTSARNRLARVHRTGSLDPSDVTRIDHIAVTRPARTLVDLAGLVPTARLAAAVDDALVRRLVTLDGLLSRVDSGAHFRGRAALATVLAAWTPGPLAGSGAEMGLVRLLRAAGLPPPVRQHEVKAGGRFVARVDLAYPAARLAIELDSFRWHAGQAAFHRDRDRLNRLEAAGWRVLHARPGADDVVASVKAIIAA